MSSIALAMFKATIGLLVNKARDKAAEKLKDGDVTAQKFHGLIVREIDGIKSKLDGISRKDLLSSISFFKEGIEILYQLFDKVISRSEFAASATPASASSEPTLELAKAGIATMELDESDMEMLSTAKGRFKDARRKATEAFNNEALDVCERILAMDYRLMATLLEAIDNPIDAYPMCKVCMEELHALPEVQKNVKVQIEKGFLSKFGKENRRQIISSVCQLNDVVYKVHGIERYVISNWPYIDTGKEKIDPLRDHRMSLSKMGLGNLCLPRSLINRSRIISMVATNTQGQFIVANEDLWDVKVYDKTGKLSRCLTRLEDGPTTEERKNYKLLDVTTDRDDNTYFLTVSRWGDSSPQYSVVYVVDNHMEHCRRLLQETCLIRSIAITDDGKTFGAVPDGLNVYDTDGRCIHSFELSCFLNDITATKDDCVMAIDRDNNVHYFTAQEHGLSKINAKTAQIKEWCTRIVFHRQSERLVVSTLDLDGELHVSIYNLSGDLAGSFLSCGNEGGSFTSIWCMDVTPEGHIAMAVQVNKFSKILVW